MEVRVLRYFLAVAREENITKAAEVLHITQPTLSRQLAQLEDDLGASLFVRGTRRITLTNEGLLLRRRAEEIVSLVNKTEREITENNEVVDGTICIGSGGLAAVEILADLLAGFKEKYPLVKYDLYLANAEQVKESMDRGLTDIGLLLEPINLDKYKFIRLNLKERWIVVMSADDPLAQRESISAKDLIGKPLLLSGRSNLRAELAAWFGDYFPKVQITYTSNLCFSFVPMVKKGLCYSIGVEGSLPFLDKSALCTRPLSPELYSSTVFAWKRHQPFSLTAAKFIEHMKLFLSENNP